VFRINDSTPDQVKVEMYPTSKARLVKCISTNDFIRVVSAQNKYSSGLLPDNCIYYKHRSNYSTFVIEYLPTKFNVSYRTDNFATSYNIITPHTLLVANVTDSGRIDRTRLFSLSGKFQAVEDILYCYPFSNVHHSGIVCWGNVELPTIENNDYRILNSLFDLFHASIFNEDLSGHYNCEHKSIQDFFNSGTIERGEGDSPPLLYRGVGGFQRALFEVIKDQEEFPTELLAISSYRRVSECLRLA
jgi:hypothetical protein